MSGWCRSPGPLGAGVVLGDRVRLAPGVVLEDGVTIGDDSELGAHVVCCRGTRIGRRCVIKAGAVLGGTGFGYISGPEGHQRIPHVGGCVLGDDVDVGANSCIDRGSIDDTVIGAGTRIDNLVHIGHNARLGEGCLLMGGVVVAGSAELGRAWSWPATRNRRPLPDRRPGPDRRQVGRHPGGRRRQRRERISRPSPPGVSPGPGGDLPVSRITDELEELVRPRSGDA